MKEEEKIRDFINKFQSVVYNFIIRREKLINKLKRIKPIPRIFKLFSPAYGVCKKCGLPWNHCHEKHIAVDKLSHVFVTCDYCWEHSTLAELNKICVVFYDKQRHTSRVNGYKMLYTQSEFLKLVEKEYYSKYSETEYKRIIRKQKLENITKEKAVK